MHREVADAASRRTSYVIRENTELVLVSVWAVPHVWSTWAWTV